MNSSVICEPYIHIFVLHVVDNVIAVDADRSQTEDARKHNGNCHERSNTAKEVPEIIESRQMRYDQVKTMLHSLRSM